MLDPMTSAASSQPPVTPGATGAPAVAPTARARPVRRIGTICGIAGRLIVGGVFIAAALGKLAEPARFADEIRKYRMVPVVASNGMAYVIPWIELSAGSLLVLSVWRGEAQAIIAVLLIIFTLAKASAQARGLRIECGCLGQLTHGWQWLSRLMEGWNGVALNLALLALLGLDRHLQPARRTRT